VFALENDANFSEARFWIASGWPTIRESVRQLPQARFWTASRLFPLATTRKRVPPRIRRRC